MHAIESRLKVKSVESGEVMSPVTFDVAIPHKVSSVLTTESVADLQITPGDEFEWAAVYFSLCHIVQTRPRFAPVLQLKCIF